MIAYTVSCTFNDPAVADRWLSWLREEHLRDVCDAGAVNASVVRMDGAPCRCEVRYTFESRDDFDHYEAEHSPRLRDDGLRRFPLELGLRYERTVGEMAAQFSRAT